MQEVVFGQFRYRGEYANYRITTLVDPVLPEVRYEGELFGGGGNTSIPYGSAVVIRKIKPGADGSGFCIENGMSFFTAEDADRGALQLVRLGLETEWQKLVSNAEREKQKQIDDAEREALFASNSSQMIAEMVEAIKNRDE